MIRVPDSILAEYAAHLRNRSVTPAHFSEYKKWLRYYLDFCSKYRLTAAKSERARLFCEKLKEKKQTEDQRERAARTISLFHSPLDGVDTHFAHGIALPSNVVSVFDVAGAAEPEPEPPYGLISSLQKTSWQNLIYCVHCVVFNFCASETPCSPRSAAVHCSA